MPPDGVAAHSDVNGNGIQSDAPSNVSESAETDISPTPLRQRSHSASHLPDLITPHTRFLGSPAADGPTDTAGRFSAAGLWDKIRAIPAERLHEIQRGTETSDEGSSSTVQRPSKVSRRATTSNLIDAMHASGWHLVHKNSSNVRSSTAIDGSSTLRPQPVNRNGLSGQGDIESSLPRIFRMLNGLSKKKREDLKHDHEKSAELVAELQAGPSAVLILASAFLRDTKDRPRLPVLLEQLKVRITDSTRTDDRLHIMFRIELEYGSGPLRMKWVVHRDWLDFFNLHSRLRVLDIQKNIIGSGKENKLLPHFPREAIPILRGMRGLNVESAVTEAGIAGPLGPLAMSSRQSLVSERGGDPTSRHQKNIKFALTQRQSLEEYLKLLISNMKFQGEANRICKFLEFSAIGFRLSAEKSYHGKEGPLSVISVSTGRSWSANKLRPSHMTALFKRYGSKWFLVRHSYILVVDSFVSLEPLDVFLVDSEFKYTHKLSAIRADDASEAEKMAQSRSLSQSVKKSTKSGYTLTLENAERKMKVLTFSEKQMKQWMESIDTMQKNTLWARKHRFESFSPVRYNVSAQWYVDGRDYFWNASRAMELAKETIYIHDWWLSPEIYLRRPAHGNQQWRLDRLLKRKAEAGVKIYVIVYRNVEKAIPIASRHTKHSLLDLHPNIFVARSPNQLRQNILFWAHHEKLLIVDHALVFLGGLDMCFGRWDTPQHVLTDCKPTGFDRGSHVDFGEDTQLWVGKDYSNARIQDFYELDKPYDDMYDRAKVPRMPWHDVHMQIFGQPARDAARHFIQRWNYLITQKRSTRPQPVLLPPPDFTNSEIEALGHLGTCEVQLLRSASGWSLGFRHDKVEHSILNAYLKAIEQSEHFIYIENQFFITSAFVNDVVIENQIGDAIVERIVRARANKEHWRAIIVIPLMPGFEAEIDNQDGTSVRLIMECQYRSISRGDNSIFGKLREAAIDPDKYIQFFSLRKWGMIGPEDRLITEQLYIHAKIMIVDDRVAIIGSANINERSMRGSRDSEVAAFIRDTDQVESLMGGKPYLVGRFAHTLRVRLMREHLGIDVDGLDELERASAETVHNLTEDQIALANDLPFQPSFESHVDKLRKLAPFVRSYVSDMNDMTNESMREDSEEEDELEIDEPATPHHAEFSGMSSSDTARRENASGSATPVVSERKSGLDKFSLTASLLDKAGFTDELKEKRRSKEEKEQERAVRMRDIAGFGPDRMSESKEAESNMEKAIRHRSFGSRDYRERSIAIPAGAEFAEEAAETDGYEAKTGFDISGRESLIGPALALSDIESQIQSLSLDPAANYLSVFVTETAKILDTPAPPLKSINVFSFEDPLDETFYADIWLAHAKNNTNIFREVFHCQPDNEVLTWQDYKAFKTYSAMFNDMQGVSSSPKDNTTLSPHGTSTSINHVHSSNGVDGEKSEGDKSQEDTSKGSNRKRGNTLNHKSSKKPPSPDINASAPGLNSYRSQRRRDQGDILDKETARKMLENVRGHLIIFPTNWLVTESVNGNWFYPLDKMPPLEIYD
ncbi:uncharacterized protein V1518DRAFT_371319 [Limtongia smithiae]|uniref:uncharacterized protein n=1 Tax=Limtongia smithiae TaxID=1125753 RepID=UPI0034CD8412